MFHIKNQNWFAVWIDFLIVVIGILIAFQITNWSEKQQKQNELAIAESALQLDLLANYFFSKERMALSHCRIANLGKLAEQLLKPEEEWQGVSFVKKASEDFNPALEGVLISPSRGWGSRLWQAELARGTFNLMPKAKRNKLDTLLNQGEKANQLQSEIWTLQSRLKVLSQNLKLSVSDRLRYYEIVAELDDKSFLLEVISQQIATAIESMDVFVDDTVLEGLPALLSASNKRLIGIHGDCVLPRKFSLFNFNDYYY
ncbi:hypothetical protein [Paraglaciecola aestuariivivens]